MSSASATPTPGNPSTLRVAGLLLLIVICSAVGPALAQAVGNEIAGGSSAADDKSSSAAQSPDATGTPASDSVVQPAANTEYVGEIYQIGLGWHPAALEGLPTDRFGLVDWVAALEQGKINPRSSVQPDAPEAPPFDMNIMMQSKTGMIEGAYFPHKTHTTWMSCDSCHIKIFMPLAGSNDLTMSTIVKGQACGVCHGKVAFPLNDCTRCHVPHEAAAEPGATED